MLIEPRHVIGHSHNVRVMSDCLRTIFEIKKETILAHVEGATYRREWRPTSIELRTMVGGECSPRELIELAQQAIHEQEKLDHSYITGEPALT